MDKWISWHVSSIAGIDRPWGCGWRVKGRVGNVMGNIMTQLYCNIITVLYIIIHV